MHQRTNWTTGASASAGVLSLSRNFPKKRRNRSRPHLPRPPRRPRRTSSCCSGCYVQNDPRWCARELRGQRPPGKLTFPTKFPPFFFFEPGGLSPALKAGRHPAIEHPVTDASEPRPPPCPEAKRRDGESLRPEPDRSPLPPTPPTPPRHPLPSTAPSVVSASASRPAPRGSSPLRVPHADARVWCIDFFFLARRPQRRPAGHPRGPGLDQRLRSPEQPVSRDPGQDKSEEEV